MNVLALSRTHTHTHNPANPPELEGDLDAAATADDIGDADEGPTGSFFGESDEAACNAVWRMLARHASAPTVASEETAPPTLEGRVDDADEPEAIPEDPVYGPPLLAPRGSR